MCTSFNPRFDTSRKEIIVNDNTKFNTQIKLNYITFNSGDHTSPYTEKFNGTLQKIKFFPQNFNNKIQKIINLKV